MCFLNFSLLPSSIGQPTVSLVEGFKTCAISQKFQVLKSFITALLIITVELVILLIYMLKYEEHTCLPMIKLAGRQ